MISRLAFLILPCLMYAAPNELVILGKQALEQKNVLHAKKYFLDAIRQDTSNFDALHGMARIYFFERDFPLSCNYLRQCLAHHPQNPDLIEQYATALDFMGDFKQARDIFEMLNDYDPTRRQPLVKLPTLYIRNKEWYFVGKFVRPDLVWWYDRDIKGKSIVLDISSQWNGRGDVMQIIRYAKHLHKAGAIVTVFVRPDLVPLLKYCPYLAHVIGSNQEEPTADITYELNNDRCIVVMKEQMYGPSPDIPYLYADEQLTKKWAQRLSIDEGMKIGICWQSTKMLDHFSSKILPGPKSVPLEKLAPLLQQSFLTFYSLQKEEDAEIEQWNNGHPHNQIIAYSNLEIVPFMDSAAMIKGLDLIITVDTAIAHLAGALGAPVWLMLPYVADYRWFNQTDTTSPLYATMKIFRQPRAGDWESVVENIINELKALCNNS